MYYVFAFELGESLAVAEVGCDGWRTFMICEIMAVNYDVFKFESFRFVYGHESDHFSIWIVERGKGFAVGYCLKMAEAIGQLEGGEFGVLGGKN